MNRTYVVRTIAVIAIGAFGRLHAAAMPPFKYKIKVSVTLEGAAGDLLTSNLLRELRTRPDIEVVDDNVPPNDLSVVVVRTHDAYAAAVLLTAAGEIEAIMYFSEKAECAPSREEMRKARTDYPDLAEVTGLWVFTDASLTSLAERIAATVDTIGVEPRRQRYRRLWNVQEKK